MKSQRAFRRRWKRKRQGTHTTDFEAWATREFEAAAATEVAETLAIEFEVAAALESEALSKAKRRKRTSSGDLFVPAANRSRIIYELTQQKQQGLRKRRKQPWPGWQQQRRWSGRRTRGIAEKRLRRRRGWQPSTECTGSYTEGGCRPAEMRRGIRGCKP